MKNTIVQPDIQTKAPAICGDTVVTRSQHGHERLRIFFREKHKSGHSKRFRSTRGARAHTQTRHTCTQQN